MDLVLFVDFLLPVTLKDNRKSITPCLASRGLGRAKGSRVMVQKGAQRWEALH